MANENQNTGPTGGINDTTGAKENIKNQGDYNSLLKESERLLKKMANSYDSIEGRIESLSKGSINLKQINQELLKAKQKDYIVSQKLEESEKQLITRGGDRLDGAKDYLIALEHIARANEDEKDQLEDIAKDLFANLDLEQQRFVNLKLANDLNKDALKYGEDKLKQEKKINDSIGISGKLLGGFAKKLGLGNEIYESMVENAKDLEKIGGKLTFFDKVKYLGKAGLSSIGESLKDPLTMLPLIGGAIGGIVSGLKAAFDYIAGIQDKTVKFARGMGISTEEARKLKMEYASLSISSGDLFVNSQRMVEAQLEMVDALGVTNRLTNEQLMTSINLKDIPGLELESRKAILESSILTGKSAQGTTESILSQVGALKNATGISFQYEKILKEASSFGGYLGLSFAKYPEKLTKSLVTVKSMGLELKQLDSMADSFLDFESSISSEFEAQLLTGKNINLAKARELFLNNDLAAAAQEITKQVGTSEEFLQLNRISAEALAKGFGMSRDELGNMLKQQELLSRLGAKDLKDAQAKVQALKAQGKTKEEIIKLTGEEAYQNLTNASMQEKIGAFMEKIQQSISDFVEKSGIIEKIESFFDYLSKPENIRKVIEGVRDFFAGAVEFIGQAAYYILEGLDYVAFGQIPNDFIESIKEGSANMGAQIRSLGGDLGAVTVSEKAAKGTVNNTSSTPSNQMGMGIQRDRGGDIYISNTIDPITPGKVVTLLSNSPAPNQDYSPIANKK
jgi:hypothetical protein